MGGQIKTVPFCSNAPAGPICQHREVKETKDSIKIATFVVGFPALTANLVHFFFKEKSQIIPYLAGITFIIGTWFAYPEEPKKIWRATAKKMCGKKAAVQNNFLLYYANTRRKEITATTQEAVKRIFRFNRPSL